MELASTAALLITGEQAAATFGSFLPSLGTVATVGGTILSAAGAVSAGRSEQTASNFQAAQLNQQAGQERATAQRQANEERRRVRLAQSRAKALSAASGAGASDPTVLDIQGDLAEEGEYRALTALYEGEERARGLQMGASAKRYEGASARRAGNMSIIGGATSLLEKYG